MSACIIMYNCCGLTWKRIYQTIMIMYKLIWREKTMCGLFDQTSNRAWISTAGRVCLGWVFSNLYTNIVNTHSVDQKIGHQWWTEIQPVQELHACSLEQHQEKWVRTEDLNLCLSKCPIFVRTLNFWSRDFCAFYFLCKKWGRWAPNVPSVFDRCLWQEGWDFITE